MNACIPCGKKKAPKCSRSFQGWVFGFPNPTLVLRLLNTIQGLFGSKDMAEYSVCNFYEKIFFTGFNRVMLRYFCGLTKNTMNELPEPTVAEPGLEQSRPSDANIDADSRQMTFGEKLVGMTFNPSGDDKVARAKRLCAELADMVEAEFDGESENTKMQCVLRDHTIGQILNAQMNVVKLLTLKY